MNFFADRETAFLRSAFSGLLVVTIGAGMLCATLHFADHWQFARFDHLFHINMLASALTVLGGSILAACWLLRPLDTDRTTARSNTHKEQLEFVRQRYDEFAAVFLVRSGVDEQVIDKFEEQLKEVVGIENLNYFRLRERDASRSS